MKKVANVRFAATVDLAKQVKTLRHQVDGQSKSRGTMSSGSTVLVDYFALRDLICYFDESREAAEAVVKVRDLMHQQYFSL